MNREIERIIRNEPSPTPGPYPDDVEAIIRRARDAAGYRPAPNWPRTIATLAVVAVASWLFVGILLRIATGAIS